VSSAMTAYRVNKADFMTLLDSQMTLYKYELEYHRPSPSTKKTWRIWRRLSGSVSLKRGRKMRKLTLLLLGIVLLWTISGCGKAKETATQKEGVKHEAHNAEEAKKSAEVKKPSEPQKTSDLEAEMKGMTMESIERKARCRRWLQGLCRFLLSGNS